MNTWDPLDELGVGAAGSKWFILAQMLPSPHNNIAVDNSNIQHWSDPQSLILSIQLFLNKA